MATVAGAFNAGLLQAGLAQVVPNPHAEGCVPAGQERRQSELRTHSDDLRGLNSRVLVTAKLDVGYDQADVAYQSVGKSRQRSCPQATLAAPSGSTRQTCIGSAMFLTDWAPRSS